MAPARCRDKTLPDGVLWAAKRVAGRQAAAGVRPTGVVADDLAVVFFVARDQYVGGWATKIIQVLIVISIFAALPAFNNAITRYCYAMASESVFPKRLVAIHSRHRSPYVAGYVQTTDAVAVVAGFAIAALAVWWFDLLAAAGWTVNTILLASVPLVFIGGTLYGWWLKARQAHRVRGPSQHRRRRRARGRLTAG